MFVAKVSRSGRAQLLIDSYRDGGVDWMQRARLESRAWFFSEERTAFSSALKALCPGGIYS